jgi:hypothetical protein
VCLRIPHSLFRRGIRRGMHDVPQAEIWCAITPVSLLFAAILWIATASLDPLEDLAHDGLCDPVRGLYGG